MTDQGLKLEAMHRELLEQVRPARRVLVVDDHPSFRRCARALLEAEGFDVVGEAEDGAGALTLAAELRPDLVLLDVQLPDIDGFAVTQRLLAHDPTARVILVSSRARRDYGSRIESCGARGFITKGDLTGAELEALLG